MLKPLRIEQEVSCGSGDILSLRNDNPALTHPFMTLENSMYQRYASVDKLI